MERLVQKDGAKMLEIIDQSRKRICLRFLEHCAAANRFTWRYYSLMVPSIVISAFLSVITWILPEEDTSGECDSGATLVQRVSAILNAVNTIILGLAALMKF